MFSSRAVHLIDESERNDYRLAERNRDHRCHTQLIISYADGRFRDQVVSVARHPDLG